MKKDKAHLIAFIGIMTALMFTVLMLETYVFIYFIKPSPAFLTIPLFIALSMYSDWKHSFIGGTIFGCCSFILSFIVGYTVFYNPLISILPRTLTGVAAYWIFYGLTMLAGKEKFKQVLRSVMPTATIVSHVLLLVGALGIFSLENAVMGVIWKVIIGANVISVLYWIFCGITKLSKGDSKHVLCAISAALTVLLHTVLVLGAMQVFSLGGAFLDTVWQVIIGVNFTAEFICAIILTPILVKVMKKITKTPDFLPLKKKSN